MAGERLIGEKLKLKKELEKEKEARERIEKNWKKTRREIITEYRRDDALDSAMYRSVKEGKIHTWTKDTFLCFI